GDCCTDLAMIEANACSMVPRVPSQKLVKEYPMVGRIGAIRNTARKNGPGNRYVKGMKRLVEYRMKIPTAASSSTASHIQDCWETSTGARKTVTARVVPSTSTRAITAGTVTDRVRCAGEWDELMGRLCL